MGEKGGARKKRVAFRRENEALLSITRRVGRTAKTCFIPGSPYAMDRCHVIATLEKRLRGKRRPVSPVPKPPSTTRPRFNRIVIKLPSIRTNARANGVWYEKVRVSAEENRKCHSSFVFPSGRVLTAPPFPQSILEGKFTEWNVFVKKNIAVTYVHCNPIQKVLSN